MTLEKLFDAIGPLEDVEQLLGTYALPWGREELLMELMKIEVTRKFGAYCATSGDTWASSLVSPREAVLTLVRRLWNYPQQ